jgi:hypothetical protein
MKMRIRVPFYLSGLSVALVLATSVAAQQSGGAPVPSVRILPDVPDPAPATAAPAISSARLELLNSSVKVENAAGVSVDLIPNLEVLAGSKVGFRVSTKKPGYLILVDVDAAGKLTQIYPNTTTVTRSTREASNFIKPGRPLTIPQVGSTDGGFDFVAELPAGVAMVVALLSDKPVQVVDLPNTPAPVTAPAEALRYVRDMTRTLKVPNPDGGQLEQPNWSFDGKFYLIK